MQDRLAKAIEMSSFEALRGQEQAEGFREGVNEQPFFRSGKAGVWQSELTPGQVDRMVRQHHDQMEKFGYLP
jgi:hypothetical protein